MLMHRGSENRKSNHSCPKKSRQNAGTEKHSAATSAAATTDCCAFWLFRARYLVMRRETVMGIPEAAAVASTAKTDRATWYSPTPSESRVRERIMRYKKPKAFSATEKAVTYAAVLYKFSLLKAYTSCFLRRCTLPRNLS